MQIMQYSVLRDLHLYSCLMERDQLEHLKSSNYILKLLPPMELCLAFNCNHSIHEDRAGTPTGILINTDSAERSSSRLEVLDSNMLTCVWQSCT